MSAVTTTRREYAELLPDVERNRAAVAGQREVKSQTTKFLPPLASMMACVQETQNGNQKIMAGNGLTPQGANEYKKYLANTYFYGATGRTVDGLVGLINSKDPIVELNSHVEYLEENTDGKGSSLRDFSTRCENEAFITPQSGILVDHPNVKQQVSRAQAENSNLRPKLLHYNFESIINWHYDVVNNQQKLTLLVLKESVQKRKNFTIECEYQYRVLEIIDGVYHQSVYDDGGALDLPAEPVLVNGSSVDEIPFYWIRVGAEMKSIINDLVDANFQHYNLYADFGSKLHYSSFIIYTETGVDPGNDMNLIIGNGVKWSNTNTDANYSILQPDGNVDGHKLELEAMEQRMAALGAEMLKPRVSGAESAEAKSLDQVAQNSTTANVAITVSRAIQQAINFASRWLGGSEDNVYKLNTDYNPNGMSPQMLTSLIAAWQAGGISYETFYENLQEGEIASTERTADEEKALTVTAETNM